MSMVQPPFNYRHSLSLLLVVTKLESSCASSVSQDYKKWQKRYINCGLLIIDDWLLVVVTEKEGREVLEIIEARHAVRSTVLCSQYSPGGWHENSARAQSPMRS